MGLNHVINIVHFISSLKKKLGSLCLFSFRDGLGTCYWGSGTAVEEGYNGLLNLSLSFLPRK